MGLWMWSDGYVHEKNEFMGTVVKRVVRKSVHANNNYTWGPAIANETTLLHLKISNC